MEHLPKHDKAGASDPESAGSCCAHSQVVDSQAAKTESPNLGMLSPLKDPVCGMSVTPQSNHFQQHEQQMYYFRSADCKTKFATNPSKYHVRCPAKAAHPTMRLARASLVG